MPKKLQIKPEEIRIFQKAVAGTKPLLQKKIRLTSSRLTHPLSKQNAMPEELLHFNETDDLPILQREEWMAYKQTAIPNKILRKLRKGQYTVEARLDLHGMSVNEAKIAVNRFLQQCLYEKMRVVLIIHGKGRYDHVPILKNKLNQWLRTTNHVLAFCSASITHGSRGALYILLKHMAKDT